MASRDVKISRIAMISVLLALIRIISECFRLNYLSKELVSFETLKPYLIGALVCAISCLAMVIFSFYTKSKMIIGIAAFTIVILVILKINYSL
jgi:hypothetical protein